MKMIIKVIFKICKFVFIGVLSLILLANLYNLVQRTVFKQEIPLILGYGNAVIITGSMEPTIIPGDIVIIHKQNEYNVGDIVTFKENSYITHRITEKTVNGYITQGDANNASDDEIDKKRVVGKVIKIVPQAGNVIFYLQNPFYMLILIIIFFAILELPRFFRKRS